MSTEDLHQWLSEFTYKPNWKFSIGTNTFSCPTLDIYVLVTDVSYPDRQASLGGGITIPDIIVDDRFTYTSRRDAFYVLLRGSIDNIEIHESDEWFRINGQMRHNPHKDGNRLDDTYHITVRDYEDEEIPPKKCKLIYAR